MSRQATSIVMLGCAAALILGALRGSETASATPQGASQEPGGSGWSANATAFRGRNGAHFVYTCPFYGAAGSVYGTDVYTDDSSVCTAAVHTGRITLAGGGTVTIEIRPGQGSYPASTRNGITSAPWNAWGGSFVFVGTQGPAPPPTGTATGTVLVNGQEFTGGTIPYGSKLDVTSGTLTMSTSLGTVAIHGDGTLPAQAVLSRSSEKIGKK